MTVFPAKQYYFQLFSRLLQLCKGSKRRLEVQISGEMNLYGHPIERDFYRLKDWRRIATRYGKLAINFASAVAIAEIIMWWTRLSQEPWGFYRGKLRCLRGWGYCGTWTRE